MNKKEVSKTGICVIGCLFIVFSLILIYLPAEKYKTKKISEEINVFFDKDGRRYKTAEAITVKSPIQNGMLVFKLITEDEQPAGFVFLIRITGICGPVPALFIYDVQKNIEFAGTFFEYDCLTDMQIAYWISHIGMLAEDIQQ